MNPGSNEDGEANYLDSLLHDPQSLHRQISLGVTDKVPNLETGGLESIIHYEMAHMLHPTIVCPSCNHCSALDSGSRRFTPSIVIRSASKQNSYLCSMCWTHESIPAFGNYQTGDGNL